MQLIVRLSPAQAAALEAGLFQMPVTSGQVPAIFADPPGEEGDPDEVAALPEDGQQRDGENGGQAGAVDLVNPLVVDD